MSKQVSYGHVDGRNMYDSITHQAAAMVEALLTLLVLFPAA